MTGATYLAYLTYSTLNLCLSYFDYKMEGVIISIIYEWEFKVIIEVLRPNKLLISVDYNNFQTKRAILNVRRV